MSSKTYSSKKKFVDKLSNKLKIDLTLDLINAFQLVKTPLETTLLLQDLLTESEIRMLSKRLRIAKLILNKKTHREVSKEVRCSIATVTKVNEWLKMGGDGLKNIISKLPKKYPPPKKLRGVPLEFQLPSLLSGLVQYGIYSKQSKDIRKVEQFLENTQKKKMLDKILNQVFSDYYKTIKK
jgi:TrpR-related protein YerC/YecD